MDDLDSRATQALTDIDNAASLEALDALRVGLLGKSGIVTAALKSLGALAPDERKARGAEVNRVKELNNRFADWYYVISEDMYKKMRLRRADLIKEKETAEEEGFGIDAFRKLEKEGLKKRLSAPPVTPLSAPLSGVKN